MKNILIIRLSAIGDIVMASAILSAIKASYPDARVSWLVQPESATLLEDNPDVDEVIRWHHKEWAALWKAKKFVTLYRTVRAFRQQLRLHAFDTVLDMQGLLKSGIPAWLSGAPLRVGLGSKEGSQWLMHQTIDRDGGENRRIGSEYRFLAEQMGLDTSAWKMSLVASAKAIGEAQQLIQQHSPDKPYVAICPFTTRPQKHWFNDYWAKLCSQLKQQGWQTVMMLGGPGDREAAAAIADDSPVLDLVGETSLQCASELIRRSALLIGVDTGLTHMGHAHEIPTVALFGSTSPYLETDNPRGKVIYHHFDCSPCRRKPTCDGRFDCLRDITPQEVLNEVDKLLSPVP